MASDSDRSKELLEKYDSIMNAPDDSSRLKLLASFAVGNAVSNCGQIHDLRSRLPKRPWLDKAIQGVGLVGLLAATTFIVRADGNATMAREESKCAKEVSQSTFDKIDERLRPVEEGIVRLTAIMEQQEHRPTSRNRLAAIRRELGLPPDTNNAKPDSGR